MLRKLKFAVLYIKVLFINPKFIIHDDNFELCYVKIDVQNVKVSEYCRNAIVIDVKTKLGKPN